MVPILFLLAAMLFLAAEHILTVRELKKSYKRLRTKILDEDDSRSGR